MPLVFRRLLLLLAASTWLGCPGAVTVDFVASPRPVDGLSDDPRTLLSEARSLREGARGTGAAGLPDLDAAAARLEKASAMAASPEVLDARALLCATWLDMVEALGTAPAGGTYIQAALRAAEALDRDAPERAEGSYYLAVAMARDVERTADLDRLPAMLEVAKRSVALNPDLDDAGALRLMGKVYLEAPSWPSSVGDPERAVEVLERALELAPTALNRLFLGEAYFFAEQPDAALAALERALAEGRASGLEDRWIAEGEAILLRLGVESH